VPNFDAKMDTLDAARPDLDTSDEQKTLDRPDAADRVVARSFYTTLRESGYTPKELLAVSTELIELVTRDLEKQD
jgi:hypothetical protein